MRSSVVASNSLTTSNIYLSHHLALDILRQFRTEVYCQIVLTFGIQHAHIAQCTRIAYLTTHLSVEWCLAEHYLIEFFAFLVHFAVAQHLCLALQHVVSIKLCLTFANHYPVAQFLFVGLATHLFLVLQCLVVLFLIGGKAVLAQNQLSKVEREAICIFQCEHIHTRNLFTFCFFHQFVEQRDTLVQCAEETVLLALDYRGDLCLLLHQFRICLAHVGNELWHQFVHKRFALSEEGVAIAHCTAQDSANHITCFLVAWQLTVGNSESDGTDMVGNHAHRHIHFLLFAILRAADFANLLQHWLEDVGIIVRLFALHGAHQTLEAHTCIDYFVGQGVKRTIGFAVVLHEHEVPNLNHLWVVFVHQFATRESRFLLLTTAIHVNLRAWTTRTCIAHLPEVVVFIAIEDMVGRQVLSPDLCCLVVALDALFR